MRDVLYSEMAAFTETQQKAERGSNEAKVRLGSMYANGFGVKLDYTKALEWYSKVTGLGFDFVQHRIILINKKLWEDKINEFNKAAFEVECLRKALVIAKKQHGICFKQARLAQEVYLEANNVKTFNTIK